MSDEGKAFWDFTLKVYGKPGMSPALIGLQDQLGADVNLLLFCCFAAARGLELDAGAIAAAERAVAGWRAQVVEPLRAIRNRIKAGIDGVASEPAMAYRKRVLELEVAGEELAQHAIAGNLVGKPLAGAPSAAARRHLELYLAGLDRKPGPEDRAALDTILAGALS
jgi:uncharacterized protein (TIGR02444 family)